MMSYNAFGPGDWLAECARLIVSGAVQQSAVKSDKFTDDLRDIPNRVPLGDFAEVLHRVRGLHRMARVVETNARELRSHLALLESPDTVLPLLATTVGQAWDRYLDEAERLVHNYLLSALPLTEHAVVHVKECYPDGHDVKVQFERGLDFRLLSWPRHQAARALRNYCAHRALPALKCYSASTVCSMANRLAMDRQELLRDPKWPLYGRPFLDQLPDDHVYLDDLVLLHAVRVEEFFQWFFLIQAIKDVDALRRVEAAEQRHKS